MEKTYQIQITFKQRMMIANGLMAYSENIAKRIGFKVLDPDGDSITMEELTQRYKTLNELIETLSQAKEI